jgi:hypothetical protein
MRHSTFTTFGEKEKLKAKYNIPGVELVQSMLLLFNCHGVLTSPFLKYLTAFGRCNRAHYFFIFNTACAILSNLTSQARIKFLQYLVPVLWRILLASSRDSFSAKLALRSVLTHFDNSSKFRQTCFVRNSGTGTGTPALFGGTRTIGVISALHMMNSRMELMQCSVNGRPLDLFLCFEILSAFKTYQHEFSLFLASECQDSAQYQWFSGYSSGGVRQKLDVPSASRTLTRQ